MLLKINKVFVLIFFTISNSFIIRVCFIYLFVIYIYSVSIVIVVYRVGSLGNDSWRLVKVSEFKIFKDFKVLFLKCYVESVISFFCYILGIRRISFIIVNIIFVIFVNIFIG